MFHHFSFQFFALLDENVQEEKNEFEKDNIANDIYEDFGADVADVDNQDLNSGIICGIIISTM